MENKDKQEIYDKIFEKLENPTYDGHGTNKFDETTSLWALIMLFAIFNPDFSGKHITNDIAERVSKLEGKVETIEKLIIK